MARSAALNPASMPFFPGSSIRSPEPNDTPTGVSEQRALANGSPSAFFNNPFHDQEPSRASLTTASDFRSLRASFSLSEYHSMSTSPSPPQRAPSATPGQLQSQHNQNQNQGPNQSQGQGPAQNQSQSQSYSLQTQLQMPEGRHQGSPALGASAGVGLHQQPYRQSPTKRASDGGQSGKPYSSVEARSIREHSSMLGPLDPLPENEDSPITEDPEELTYGSRQQTPGLSIYSMQQQQQQQQPYYNQPRQQRTITQQMLMATKEREYSNAQYAMSPSTGSSLPYTSASPVSSLDSKNSRATTSSVEPIISFEDQLKSSPLMRDVLSRLVQVEYTTRDIQRDLSDINRKVNILVERALNAPSANLLSPHQQQQQPEFLDPFATNSSLSPLSGINNVNGNGIGNGNRSGNGNGNSISHHLKPRASMGNIAPNQASNGDDISSISQRLNTLTSSVGQLLALQTQQMQTQQLHSGIATPTIAESRNNSVINLGGGGPTGMMSLDIPNGGGMGGGGGGGGGLSMIGHGLPNRPGRQPTAPLRTLSWSPGIMNDTPVRPIAQLALPPSMSKRPSVSSLLRRDSSGMIDQAGDNWIGGTSARDNSPMISKWEQLSLAPELLRSLGKFGVGPPNKIQQRALPFLLRGSDIIAQAPPTQERIAAYVIPAIQVAVTHLNSRSSTGPLVVIISTTVDQATQAQRMIRDLGGPIGVKSALGVGASTATAEELRVLQQTMPHILCGTPQKLHALFTAPGGGLSGAEVRFLVLDEVDQLIARNLHEFVYTIVKLLPPPRSRPISIATSGLSSTTPVTPGVASAGSASTPQMTFTSPFEPGNPVIPPFQSSAAAPGSGPRLSTVPSPGPGEQQQATSASPLVERQTAIFSNTVPQDVLNLASQIHLREPVRVLVRRDGNVASSETNQGSRGLRQYYLYLAFTAGGRSEPLASTAGGGLGIIGSGRSASSAETTQAREWKLDALADIFDEIEVGQAIVHVGGMNALDSVVYKLASRGIDAIALHGDMNTMSRVSALTKFRSPATSAMRQPVTKALVVYDVQFKNNEVPHVPLVINYDLPKAVEEYSHRISSAVASNYSRAGVVINFVTATGGDVEMLRSIECFYKIKCPEVPMSLRDIL